MRGSLPISRRSVFKLRQVGTAATGSAKIRIFLCVFIVLTLIAVANRNRYRSSSFIGWTGGDDRSSTPKGRYSIVMNTWKRYDLLKKSISHYASCPRLDSIHIVWSEPDPPSDKLKLFLNHAVRLNSRKEQEVVLVFDVNKEDSLNNRFKEIKDLKTDAVFSIDDDIIFPCSSVEFAFTVWQSAPDTMVGYVPRMHWVDQKHLHIPFFSVMNLKNITLWSAKHPKNWKNYPLDVFIFMQKGNDKYNYGGWWSVWWTGSYSMVLSKAAFFHKKYLKLYTDEMPASIKEYTTKNRNCEDIAMSFLVANATGSPPIWVEGKIYEIGSTGISSLEGHNDKRTECVNKFVTEFGRMPLLPTNLKAVDSRSSWFW